MGIAGRSPFEPRMSARKENRSKAYKAGINTDESRRRREETTVQLRRNKREDSLMKRRKDQTAQFDQSDGAMAGAGQDAMAQIPAPNTPSYMHFQQHTGPNRSFSTVALGNS